MPFSEYTHIRMHVLARQHTVLSATNMLIYKWLRRITALWPVLISRPTMDRRLSWVSLSINNRTTVPCRLASFSHMQISRQNKQVHPSSGTDVYPHMPILRPHAARFHERRISSVTFTSAHLYGNVYMWVGVARALADSSDFGLLWEQSSQKCVIPCLGRR